MSFEYVEYHGHQVIKNVDELSSGPVSQDD